MTVVNNRPEQIAWSYFETIIMNFWWLENERKKMTLMMR